MASAAARALQRRRPRAQGLGKTIQTISLLATLAERKGVAGPHMILAPKAVQSNWAAEFAKWAPGLKAVLYDGTPDERRALRTEHVEPGGFNTLITHYDLALRDRAALRKARRPWRRPAPRPAPRRPSAGARFVAGRAAAPADSDACRQSRLPIYHTTSRGHGRTGFWRPT